MPQPEVGEVALRIYESPALEPWASQDAENDYHFLLFIDALSEVLFEKVHTLVSDRVDEVGWQVLLDPELAPAWALPYLAQYVGAVLEPSLTEAEQRAKIGLPENFKRGTLAAMLQAVKRTLTGTQTVLIEERYGSAYSLWVRTYDSETPDPAATEAAVLSQKPGGLTLVYQSITGQTWGDLNADHATWTLVLADYATWEEVTSDLP